MAPNSEMSAPVKFCIVDDEAPGRTNLRLALAAHPRWQLAYECASAAAARTALAQAQVDVLFLDIQMPGESGIALARSLCELESAPLIVFVTAHDHYAVSAFDLHALDYLVKPWHGKRLAEALSRAEHMLELRQHSLHRQALRECLDEHPPSYLAVLNVRSVGKLERIDLSDVNWIGAAGNYVELHTAGRTVLHRIPIGSIAERLDPAQFLRVHRTAIVRREQCAALKSVGDGRYSLQLRCGSAVPVSERHLPALRQAMQEPGN
jgi:two-component system LytT family response regulator